MTEAVRLEHLAGSSVTALWGAADEGIGAALAQLGATRAALVCGESIGRSDLVRQLVAAPPPGVGFSVFGEVEPDPSDETVRKGGAAVRAAGAQAVVAIGGGSSMDAAKAIAAEAACPGWIATQDTPGQPAVVAHEPLPVIAVPTTAGTGSEVTSVAVITFLENKRKIALNHPALFARFAVMDPSLLASAPRSVRVAAGMDALTHAVESFVNRQATESTRAQCYEAIELIGRHLRTVASAPDDAAAMAGMQRASLVAGLAFAQTRLGIVHAMALPLSALFGVPHGIANAILLPFGMRFNHLANAAGFAEVARALGVDTGGLAEADAALAAVGAVEALSVDVGAPQRMSDVGITRDALGRMADDAMSSAHLKVNPREVSRENVLALYEEAF